MAKTKTKGPAPETAPAAPAGPVPKPRLQVYYLQTVRPKLAQQFGFTNPHQIPRLMKIVLNVGEGEGMKNAKLLDTIVDELGRITGQRAVVTRAKKSIANFSLRQGMAIGASVTLRVRDFRGLPTRSFDGRGNYSVGIKEQMIFPEIDYDKVEKIHGMDITFVTSTSRDDVAMALLREMGMPFRGETPVTVG
jgi:large subunit ribosomal protein L5